MRARSCLGARLMVACLVFLPALAVAQTDSSGPRFADPVRLKAGDAFLGANRLYPSPALHDVDRDGIPDLLIGDLPGRVTWARREGQAFHAETKFLGKDGKPLKFNNW